MSEAKTKFEKWFENSKVVSAGNEPLVVYHGTLRTFDNFSTSLGEHSIFGRGAYFTSSPSDASRYASKLVEDNPDIPAKAEFLQAQLEISYQEAKDIVIQGNEQVYPVYLSIKDPLDIGGFPIVATKQQFQNSLQIAGDKNSKHKAKILAILAELDMSDEKTMHRTVYEGACKYDLLRTERVIELLERNNYSVSNAQFELLGGAGAKELMLTLNKDGIIFHNVEKKFSWMEPSSKHYFVRNADQIINKFDQRALEYHITISNENINDYIKKNEEAEASLNLR